MNKFNLGGQNIKIYVGVFVFLGFGNTYIKENNLEASWIILFIFGGR